MYTWNIKLLKLNVIKFTFIQEAQLSRILSLFTPT